MKIETHCHSLYSHDSSLSIQDIIEKCKENDIGGIIICDHDNCGITEEDERLFLNSRVLLIKGIEFTSFEGVHIIGCHPLIKNVEKPPFTYGLIELIDLLKSIGATIIIPHPNHATGIIGNGKISADSLNRVFSKADFVEIDNYRYGKTKNTDEISKQYPNIRFLIGSDAHSQKDVGAYCNEFDIKCNSIEDIISTNSKINMVRNKNRSAFYWKWQKIKRKKMYQYLMKMFPAGLRRKIKNLIVNR